MLDHQSHSPEHCGDLDSLLRFIEWLLKHRKEFNMQAQLTVNFTVGGGVQPLVVTPAVADLALTVGTPADGTPVAVVTGGRAPYTYSLNAASGPLPPGVNFAEDSNGNITLVGTPTEAGTGTSPVLLDIFDADGATAQLQRVIR